MVSWSRIYAPGYGDLTLGRAEIEEKKNLCILGVTLDPNLMVQTYLREVVSNAAKNMGVVRRARKLLDCSSVLKSCCVCLIQTEVLCSRVAAVCRVSSEFAG